MFDWQIIDKGEDLGQWHQYGKVGMTEVKHPDKTLDTG